MTKKAFFYKVKNVCCESNDKDDVYASKPKTLNELKIKIIERIEEIPNDMLLWVGQNYMERVFKCEDRNGSHYGSIIIKRKFYKLNFQSLSLDYHNKNMKILIIGI